MQNVKFVLEEWLEVNPDGWKDSDIAISKATQISVGSIHRYIPEIIAKRDGIMPSKVQELRRKEGRVSSRKPKADPNAVMQIIKENPGAPICDLAYLANCSPGAIKRVLKKMRSEPEAAEVKGEGKISDLQDQIDHIQSEIDHIRAALSQLASAD